MKYVLFVKKKPGKTRLYIKEYQKEELL